MPWINEGGNGGSWKPSNGGPWGQKPSSPQPDFEDFVRRGQEKLKQWIPGSGGGFGGARGVIALALVGVIFWLLSGFYTVEPNEVGLNKIFGRYTGKTGPGLNYNLPYPIGEVQKLQVTNRNTINVGFAQRPDMRAPNAQTSIDLPEESLMLTGDENIADVKFVVIWQIDPVHPEDYAFNIANQRETVKAVAESAMREVIGRSQIQRILTAERKVIEPAVQELMQKILNQYKAGVLILQVQLQSVDPPEQVIAAFRDVTAAQQDQNRMRNEAEAYANRVVPEARGKAAATIQEAEGYRLQTVAEATGQAARFNKIYEQYKKAPDVTRERMYLETMERVYGGMDKVIVDQGAQGTGVVPYLPLGALSSKPSDGSRK
ncbi:Protein HflK [Methylocella tundrae]|uniref:Protein HflK n=1 Tax=Methylocella tundrae TaxID=227605 RepID=A0A4U8YYX9_METTU|nr:FtsH protease activity modulator HflK [Methylocella tundrae]WPP05625.1 FtsH protease activity modulator HflK [Methylocella tundrae]VFU08088.1 Protein HflK [Methylocella tundrae]VTZ28150.1 Protein HflK [Methylocella tundrae]VTZ52332.1 Protein HflK [Methylocella tundrae]